MVAIRDMLQGNLLDLQKQVHLLISLDLPWRERETTPGTKLRIPWN